MTDTANSVHHLFTMQTKYEKSCPQIGTYSENPGSSKSERIRVMGKVDAYKGLSDFKGSLEAIFSR